MAFQYPNDFPPEQVIHNNLFAKTSNADTERTSDFADISDIFNLVDYNLLEYFVLGYWFHRPLLHSVFLG